MRQFSDFVRMQSKPAPQPTNCLDEAFWAFCAEEKLHFQRCNGCDSWRHLPRYVCARCGSDQWRWEAASGRGTLYSWTVVHFPMHAPFSDEVPYVIALVEMSEGVRMVAQLRGVESDGLSLGMPLAVYFEADAGRQAMPYFKPEE